MDRKKLWQSSIVWAPSFPRKSADDGTYQARRANRGALAGALERAAENEMPGYYSVYSFPRGEPKEGAVPRIDCIFIDLDVPGRDYQPNPNKAHYDTSMAAWRRSMSDLLARARMIADAILTDGQEQHFRVVLSGHKGIHLYLDFPAVSPENGDIGQFKSGLSQYGSGVMDWLDQAAGGVNIEPWVDVDGSDLARLARHPNTPHHGAAYDDELRWCVPLTVEELSELTVDGYLDLTSEPRWPDGIERVPSETAHDKVVQAVRSATSSGSGTRSATKRGSSEKALQQYTEETQNDDITLDDVLFFTKNKPCIRAFRQRDDAYDYGDASRAMELSIMGRLIDMEVPRDVMHEFFEPIPGYDEAFTDELIGDLLARGNEYGEFSCRTIAGGHNPDGKHHSGHAPQFCLDDRCSIYNREPDIEKV